MPTTFTGEVRLRSTPATDHDLIKIQKFFEKKDGKKPSKSECMRRAARRLASQIEYAAL